MSSKPHYQWVEKNKETPLPDKPERGKNPDEKAPRSGSSHYRERSKEPKHVKKYDNKHTRQPSYPNQKEIYDDSEEMLRRYNQKPQKKWRNVTTYQVKQVNDVEQQRYDVQTLVSAFKQESVFPEELSKFQEQFPAFFLKVPTKPLCKLNEESQQKSPLQHHNQHSHSHQHQQPHYYHRKQSSESDPEWMDENNKVEDCVQTFEFKDIEDLLEEKRVNYQKEHGTFERKQREREEKQKQKQEKELKEKQFQEEMEKYKKMKEQKKREETVQKPSNQIQDIFQLAQAFNPTINDDPSISNAMTLEQLEKNLLSKSQPPIQPPYQNPLQPQQQLSLFPATDEDVDIMKLFAAPPAIPEQKKPQPKLIPPEKIETNPFQVHAVLNNKNPNDSCWFYIDQHRKVQGGFSSLCMDQWYQQRYFLSSLPISWLKPGAWLTLGIKQFLVNLIKVNDGKLPPNKAMDPTATQQVSQVPCLEYMMLKQQQMVTQDQTYNLTQQQLQELLRQYQIGTNQSQASHINILNNVIQITPQQQYPYFPQQQRTQQQYNLQQLQFQQQQYLHMQQQQGYTAAPQNKKNTGKRDEQKNPDTIFNIGTKKAQQPQPIVSNGIVIDTKEFPTLGEIKKEHTK